jgi:hypothetical protein
MLNLEFKLKSIGLKAKFFLLLFTLFYEKLV